ncbi:hypothetical protein EB796_000286 [Bugula neritina]|uniref:Uncharacterized protein n=1 Tax=Bugula neritina TaxID=10212 RepID=A0A7J7KTA5_BUGNE|nr:hypothetical protein EB796_000286 [Bugula neritina]
MFFCFAMLCDDPLGLFSTESSDIKESLPPKVDHTVESNANAMTSSVTSMDIGNLFGRDSSLKKNSADETVSMRTVKKYNLLEFSPEKEVAPALTPGLRKSLSLDSRASYQAAIKDEDSKSADAVLDAPTFEKPSFPPNPNLDGSKESIKSSGGDSLSSDHEKGRRASSSYKSWVTSSIKKGANLAIAKNLSSKMKSMVYGEKEDTEPHTNMSSHESLDSVDTTSKINK